MLAGESARVEARRAREKAARLLQYADSYERGALGEDTTARALGSLPTGWTALHDRRWPGRRLANIDHVVVGPGGVFVVDTKNWSGTLSLSQGRLRQNGHARDKAVAAAADAALAIAGVIAPYARHVHPVLCFAGEARASGSAGGVAVCTTDDLAAVLLRCPEVLTPEQAKDVLSRLELTVDHASGSTRSSVAVPAAAGSGASSARSTSRRAASRQPASRPSRHAHRLGRFIGGVAALVALATVGPTASPLLGDLVANLIAAEASPTEQSCPTVPSDC